MTPRTVTTTRRVAGKPVQVEVERDGVQRFEWLTYAGGSQTYGVASKHRHSGHVTARRPGGDTKLFLVGMSTSTDQAFAAARNWLVGGAA